MIEVILGNYIIKNDDILLSNIECDFITKTVFNKDKTYVILAEEAGLTKDKLVFIKDNAKTDIKIVAQDKGIVKNLRTSKNFKITYEKDFTEANPFDITKSILTVKDRDYIFNFLKENKVSLYMPVKILTSNYADLCDTNKQITKFLDLYFYKCSPEVLYAIIAYRMKVEPYFRFCKWNFPKKEE